MYPIPWISPNPGAAIWGHLLRRPHRRPRQAAQPGEPFSEPGRGPTVLRHGVTLPPARGGKPARVRSPGFPGLGGQTLSHRPEWARPARLRTPQVAGLPGRPSRTHGRCSIPRTVATAWRWRLTQSLCFHGRSPLATSATKRCARHATAKPRSFRRADALDLPTLGICIHACMINAHRHRRLL